MLRQAMLQAMAVVGGHFVLGRTIDEALSRARQNEKRGFRHSYDMLGEAALTARDADRYFKAYEAAIHAIGKANARRGPIEGPGISIKLSALHPRYELRKRTRALEELYPRILALAVEAKKHDIGCTIDAEEADRLDLSLDIIGRLIHAPELAGWNGLGLAIQAYSKRVLALIDWLVAEADKAKRRLMVRLVKGAYWDSEIKRAQVAGRPDYPVYTTKAATDLSYLVCAKALIDASPALYPQFASHNAHTLAAVRHMADAAGVRIEHQRLHGMGEALYAGADQRYGGIILRAYAPVGGHEELLPYLVRRLLENGANTSFVHALLDEEIPAAEVVRDPIAIVEAHPKAHAKIPVPQRLYGAARRNSQGRDFSLLAARDTAGKALAMVRAEKLGAGPIIGGKLVKRPVEPVTNPADRSMTIGQVGSAVPADIDAAIKLARKAQPRWNALTGTGRAVVLRAMADALEAEEDRLVALLSLEAGKTLNDGVAEVREAVDFCRYYAMLAERQFGAAVILDGPVGEVNSLELHGRGVFACISPWNFPLAIFTGQIAAALAAGNAVLAKPAEQTPLIAAEAVRIYHKAGLDPALLALVPGDGASVGAALVAHPGIDGVAFTGGTDTAGSINRTLAARPGPIVPFIAETGGLNGMFVDSTALREQVVDDVILSAFGSAGQRCSALRLLYLPKDTAEETIATLVGALEAQVLANPSDPSTDIGPVIDEEAREALNKHVVRLEKEARIVARLDPGALGTRGSFFGPVIAEVPTPDFLEREVFGPILHIYRYDPNDLEAVAGKLAARGYGLTLGVHSRIDRFAEEVREAVPAGNVYVNRSIIGAVVGVQPFGGEGLSGTGPKAGGPHALLRYALERAISVNITAQGGDPALLNL
jgi:RHH-type proline utilization regulon transcriptional repressor/proline dehydrogenase/delta 1-pyrroline-5-carboxylate dehydrogenase